LLPSVSVGGANVMLFLYSVVNCGSCQYQDGKAVGSALWRPRH